MNPKRFTVESKWIHRTDREHANNMRIDQPGEEVQRLARAATAKWKKYRSKLARSVPYSALPNMASQKISRMRVSSFLLPFHRGS